MIEHLLQAERALANGLLDQAEALYRSAADADPRNAIAVVGLARVAVERGDEPRAMELGLRALAIDPENSAAQRLVARIREVRAYRGESVEGWTPDEVLAAAPKVASDPAGAREVESTPESEPTPDAESMPEAEPTPEAAPEAEVAPPTIPTLPPPPARQPPRRRSLLARLLGRPRHPR